MNREIRIFASHESARTAGVAEWAAMSKEDRLRVGAELHAFWVSNYFPNVDRMERTAQVVQREQ